MYGGRLEKCGKSKRSKVPADGHRSAELKTMPPGKRRIVFDSVLKGGAVRFERSAFFSYTPQDSIYAPYGMTYDTEKDRFLYNGQIVRYFKNQINSDETNALFDDGVVDVEPIRDTTGTLTGLA